MTTTHPYPRCRDERDALLTVAHRIAAAKDAALDAAVADLHRLLAAITAGRSLEEFL